MNSDEKSSVQNKSQRIRWCDFIHKENDTCAYFLSETGKSRAQITVMLLFRRRD